MPKQKWRQKRRITHAKLYRGTTMHTNIISGITNKTRIPSNKLSVVQHNFLFLLFYSLDDAYDFLDIILHFAKQSSMYAFIISNSSIWCCFFSPLNWKYFRAMPRWCSLNWVVNSGILCKYSKKKEEQETRDNWQLTQQVNRKKSVWDFFSSLDQFAQNNNNTHTNTQRLRYWNVRSTFPTLVIFRCARARIKIVLWYMCVEVTAKRMNGCFQCRPHLPESRKLAIASECILPHIKSYAISASCRSTLNLVGTK